MFSSKCVEIVRSTNSSPPHPNVKGNYIVCPPTLQTVLIIMTIHIRLLAGANYAPCGGLVLNFHMPRNELRMTTDKAPLCELPTTPKTSRAHITQTHTRSSKCMRIIYVVRFVWRTHGTHARISLRAVGGWMALAHVSTNNAPPPPFPPICVYMMM